MKDHWDFVEKYHPNYSQSKDIALSNCLQMIIDGEWSESNSATLLLIDLETEIDYTNGWDVSNLAKDKLAIINAKIFQEAIEGFMSSTKESIAVTWHYQDVISRAKDKGIKVGRKRAIEIIDMISKNHDANVGVNWDVIDEYLI